jgi:hypothetical protein
MKMKKLDVTRNFTRIAIPVLLSMVVGNALAQDTPTGEVQAVNIVIKDVHELSLESADRNFDKIPPRPSDKITPPIQYDFVSYSFKAPAISPQIRPLKLKPVEQGQVYGGFLRLGYGNYGSPLLEGYLTTRKDKNKLIGVNLYHFSSRKGPVDGTNSGGGNTRVALFGRSLSKNNMVVSGRIDAENRATHFYGYREGTEVDRSEITQAYNMFRISGDMTNADNSAFGYKLGGAFSFLSDKYDAQESEFDVTLNSAYKVSDDNRLNLDGALVLLNRKDADVDGKLRSLFTFSPSYSFIPTDGFKVKLGMSFAYENDTINEKSFHVYPMINASYAFSPSMDIFVSIDGAMDKVSLQTLSYRNIWLGSNVDIYHTNKFYELNVGINGKLGNKFGIHAGIANATYRNMPFFVNRGEVEDPLEQAKFDVVYNRETNFIRTSLYATLSYAQSEKAKFMLRGDLFSYSHGEDPDVPEPWHLPTHKVTLNGSYNVSEVLILTVDVIAQGGMKALDPYTENVVKLKGAFDLNAKAEYLFSKSFSIFAQFNNITGQNYPVYLYYPVRGFQFLGGITWSF